MRSPEMTTTCGICGQLVRPWFVEAHLNAHSFAELLRFEIRQDLEQVPEEERPSILRDVYRGLLGTTVNNDYRLDPADGEAVYPIEEVLGDAAIYGLWLSANRCGDPSCTQHGRA